MISDYDNHIVVASRAQQHADRSRRHHPSIQPLAVPRVRTARLAVVLTQLWLVVRLSPVSDASELLLLQL